MAALPDNLRDLHPPVFDLEQVTVDKLADALGISLPDLLTRCEQLRRRQTVNRINLSTIVC